MQVKNLRLKRVLCAALLVLLLVAGMQSYAERVEPEVARAVAATFLNNNGVRSNQLTNLSERAGFPNLYIFNGESGFVVMAADDCAKPILGYSLTGQFLTENMPENLRWWLQGYNDQIQYAIDNQLRNSSDATQEWEELRNGRPNVGQRAVVVGPLISTKWGQGIPYNQQCPSGYLTGCLATAMAQIMKYHNYPPKGIGSHSYSWNGQILSANFGNIVYDWENMDNIYDTIQGNDPISDSAVATLMHHCGVAVDMNYNVDNSGESEAVVNKAVYALQAYFDYDICELLPKNDYQEYWVDWLKDELDSVRPLLYYGKGSGGHAFVCDGYDEYNCFHFNWGWNGGCDGYYSLDALYPMSSDPNNNTIYGDFTNNQCAIFGIQPSGQHSCNAPTNLTATLNDRTATLSWTAAEGVDSYRVYYEGLLIDSNVTGTTFTDYASLEIGTHHYYVRSNCADGSLSGSSIIVEVEVEFQGNETATIDNLRYSLNEQNLTAEVIGRKTSYNSGNLIIPTMVTYTNQYGQTHTYTVTSIGDSAFSYCSDFTGSLTIPNSVKSIGSFAFSGCSGFTGCLTIPNSVTSIGDGSFSGCSGLTALTIGNSVTSIGNNAFNNCSGFTGNLTIGNSVTSIGYYAFSGCSGLTDLTIGNSVISIGFAAFYGCSGLTGDLVIPNSVTSIGNNAFRNCSELTSLTLGSSVTSVGNNAFENCSGLNTVYWNAVDLENILTTYPYNYSEEHPFRGCTSLATVVFGELVQTIPNYALYQCAGISLVTIGNSVTTIGASAFSGCSGLTGEMVIPNSVTSIGAYAFRGCNGLTGDLIIPGSVTSISSHAFEGCAGGNLIISNGVISIGEYAFYGCSGFTGTLSIGNSLTEIGYAAFENCSGFSGDLIIPNSVTSIEEYAFHGCSGFNGTLSLPNALAKISHAAFANCGFVGELILPNTITSIELNAFLGCNGFSGNLVIPNSVTTIECGAFRNCSGFTGDLVIPNSVIAIENGYSFGAFQGCSGLSSIYSYGAVPPTAGYNAFNGIDFSIPVYVPSCSATKYAEAAQWSDFTNYQATLPCVPTFTGSDSDNLWSNPDNWSILPDGNDDIIINAYCEIDMDVEALKIIINNSGTLVVKSGYVLTVGEIINWGSVANIIVEDGGQLVYNQNGLQGTVRKDISSYTMEENDGWHLIAYPLVENGMVASQSNMLSNSYDLYYYDEPTHYWINQKDDENNFTLLESGKGYLYANQGFGGGNVAGSKIGEGSSTIGYVPFYTYYEYTIAENLFLASELEAASVSTTPLGGLCWYATNETGYQQSNISIWMANVNDEALTTTSHNVSGMTLVYTGNMTPVVGWNAFVFNENTFTWDGTSNVLVCVQRNNGLYNSTIYWQAHNPDFEATSYRYNINSAYDMTTTTYTMYVSSTERPNTIFQTLEQVGQFEYYEPITLSFSGELENGSATINIPLSYTETAGGLKGFNLMGNPFVHNVTSYVSTNVAEGCFRLNETRDNLIVSEISETMPLKPAEGFFVKATAEGASITFNAQTRGETKRGGFVNLELNKDDKLIDRLIVKREGEPLEKLSLKENGTKIFAKQGHQEMAVIVCEGNEQPVNFKAARNGSYTINVNVDNMEFDYLHLIDNLTGADVDLLSLRQAQEPMSYTFEAKTTDYDSRFKLVFSVSGDADGDNDAPFAFINNGNIIIVGAEDGAVLQIVDVLGRVLVCRDALNASAISTTGMAPGVYVLRLINGDDVKTQKIMVE